MTINCKISNKSFVVCLITMLLALGAIYMLAARGTPQVAVMKLEKLPMEINGMQGVEDSFPESVYKELNADAILYRHFRSSDGREVDLYIGYYGTAKGGRTGHNPKGCLPSQGWGLIESSDIILKSAHYPRGVPVSYLLSTKGDSSMTMIHWYQSEGTKVLSSGIRQNIHRFLGMIFRNRNDGAFIQITVLSDKTGAGSAKAVAISFSEQILNMLPDYWPVEK